MTARMWFVAVAPWAWACAHPAAADAQSNATSAGAAPLSVVAVAPPVNGDERATSCEPWPADASEQERRLIELVNEARARGAKFPDGGEPGPGVLTSPWGLPRLTVSAKLGCAARLNSLDIARTGHFAHRNLDGLGPSARAHRVGYGGQVLENLAWGQKAEQGVLDAWLASPAHCRTLLFAAGTEIGAGLAVGAAGKPFWTLLVGSG